jgi:hypothetical protein
MLIAYDPISAAKSTRGSLMRKVRGWVMPEDDARSMLQQIEERIRSSDIEVEHRDVLIRLRSLIEEDLAMASQGAADMPDQNQSKPQAA